MAYPSTANPPFPRGETFDQFTDDQTADTTAGTHFEGMEFMFDDQDFGGATGGGPVPTRTGRQVLCRIVRNSSGSPILPKRWVKNKTDGSTPDLNLGRTAGYATAITDSIMGVADEFLPAAGVADGLLFWVVVEGLSKVTTAGSGDTNIPVGGAVIPSTSGTSIQGVETAGGTATTDIDLAYNTAKNTPGYAVTAVNGTATDFYVNVRKPRL